MAVVSLPREAASTYCYKSLSYSKPLKAQKLAHKFRNLLTLEVSM